MKKFVAYLRVSTVKQGDSGLGLEAQRKSVEDFARNAGGRIVKYFTEIESGKDDHRKELEDAVAHAKATNSTLLIAALDRLSRNADYLIRIRQDGLKIMACDGETQDGDILSWGLKALLAQRERTIISERTKKALAALKARTDIKLGNPQGVAPLRRANKGNRDAVAALKANADAAAYRLRHAIKQYRSDAPAPLSLRAIAQRLTDDGFEPPRGGRWHASNVRNLLARLETVA